MFDKDKAIDGPGTVVGANVKLSGVLKDSNEIVIHGHIEGEVNSDKQVVIEQSASVKGPITAKEVIVSGKVDGHIKASSKLTINETGEVKGSIYTNELTIKPGAVFNGKSQMKGQTEIEDEETPAPKKVEVKVEKEVKISNDKYELE